MLSCFWPDGGSQRKILTICASFLENSRHFSRKGASLEQRMAESVSISGASVTVTSVTGWFS